MIKERAKRKLSEEMCRSIEWIIMRMVKVGARIAYHLSQAKFLL
jgi:hypothetical protein